MVWGFYEDAAESYFGDNNSSVESSVSAIEENEWFQVRVCHTV